jgi:hypothetical protein
MSPESIQYFQTATHGTRRQPPSMARRALPGTGPQPTSGPKGFDDTPRHQTQCNSETRGVDPVSLLSWWPILIVRGAGRQVRWTFGALRPHRQTRSRVPQRGPIFCIRLISHPLLPTTQLFRGSIIQTTVRYTPTRTMTKKADLTQQIIVDLLQ